MLALGLGGRVMFVDEVTGEVRWAVEAHIGENSQPKVAMSKDGRLCASVGRFDEHWTLWEAANGEVHRVGDSHDGTGACICGVPKVGSRLLWEPLEGCPVVAHSGRGIWAVAFSPSGLSLATGGGDGAVILWNVQTGKAARRMMEEDPEGVSALAFSADGSCLSSGTVEGIIFVWDTTTGAMLLRMHEDNPGEVKSLQFSPTDNNQLASAAEGEVALWDVVQRAMVRTSEERGRLAVFSPDGRTLATVNGQGARDVHLVDAETGAVRVRVVGHQQVVFCVAFSVTLTPQP